MNSLYIKDTGWALYPAENNQKKKAISESHLPFNLCCFRQTFRLYVLRIILGDTFPWGSHQLKTNIIVSSVRKVM